MANRTVKDAKSIRGTNPQYLVEKIIRSRIYDSKYWKEECFALTAELLVDKAMELRYIGGIYGGNTKPTPFLCLILKMLQIQPEKDIIVEFIKNEEFKYVRALGALYMRLTGTSLDCYKYLEPLFNDNRKLRRQNKDGVFELVHMDELIDELLRDERSCDVILPRVQRRHVLEENNELEAKVSALEDDMDEAIESSSSEEEEDLPTMRVDSRKRNDEYDRDRERNKDRDKRYSRTEKRSDRERQRSRSKERDRDRRPRKRSRSPKPQSSTIKEKEREKDRHRRERENDRGGGRRRDRDRPRH